MLPATFIDRLSDFWEATCKMYDKYPLATIFIISFVILYSVFGILVLRGVSKMDGGSDTPWGGDC